MNRSYQVNLGSLGITGQLTCIEAAEDPHALTFQDSFLSTPLHSPPNHDSCSPRLLKAPRSSPKSNYYTLHLTYIECLVEKLWDTSKNIAANMSSSKASGRHKSDKSSKDKKNKGKPEGAKYNIGDRLYFWAGEPLTSKFIPAQVAWRREWGLRLVFIGPASWAYIKLDLFNFINKSQLQAS